MTSDDMPTAPKLDRNMCPADCGRTRRRNDFLCRRCWFTLPIGYRTAVWDAFRNYGPWSPALRMAHSAALDWLANNTP